MNTSLQPEPQSVSDTPSAEGQPPPLPRHRGGQAGNQNARTHGFYSSALPPHAQQALERADQLHDLRAEIALLRVKLLELVAYPDAPPELLFRVARLLTRMLDVQHKITS